MARSPSPCLHRATENMYQAKRASREYKLGDRGVGWKAHNRARHDSQMRVESLPAIATQHLLISEGQGMGCMLRRMVMLILTFAKSLWHAILSKTVCPSGLRGLTQVPLARAAWAQIQQLSFCSTDQPRGVCVWQKHALKKRLLNGPLPKQGAEVNVLTRSRTWVVAATTRRPNH